MATNKSFNILIVLMFSTLVNQLGCRDCSPGNENNRIYVKGGGAIVTPDSDSIQVGDTLWLNSVIPAKLTEIYSNGDSSKIDLNGASNMTTQLEFLSLVGINNNPVGALDSFNFIYDRGSFSPVPQVLHSDKVASYLYQNGNYIFSLGIIAQKKGIYYLAVLNSAAQKRCAFVTIETHMKNLDSHLYYLKDTYYGGGAISPADSIHAYCFKVY